MKLCVHHNNTGLQQALKSLHLNYKHVPPHKARFPTTLSSIHAYTTKYPHSPFVRSWTTRLVLFFLNLAAKVWDCQLTSCCCLGPILRMMILKPMWVYHVVDMYVRISLSWRTSPNYVRVKCKLSPPHLSTIATSCPDLIRLDLCSCYKLEH